MMLYPWNTLFSCIDMSIASLVHEILEQSAADQPALSSSPAMQWLLVVACVLVVMVRSLDRGAACHEACAGALALLADSTHC